MQARTAVSEGRVQGSAVHEHGGERVQVQLLAGGGASVPLPSRARGPELKLRLLHLYRQAHTCTLLYTCTTGHSSFDSWTKEL